MMPTTDDLVCEWCRTQVENPISVFQIRKKSEEFNSEARGNPVSPWNLQNSVLKWTLFLFSQLKFYFQKLKEWQKRT
jgi:hypothetical protein